MLRGVAVTGEAKTTDFYQISNDPDGIRRLSGSERSNGHFTNRNIDNYNKIISRTEGFLSGTS